MQITQSEFARRTGYSRQFISALINGVDRCGGLAAIKLKKKTKGAIGIAELIEWKQRAAA